MINTCRILVGNLKGRDYFRHKFVWVEDTEMAFKEIWCEVLDWIQVAQDCNQCCGNEFLGSLTGKEFHD
jgi:hypothetical protein